MCLCFVLMKVHRSSVMYKDVSNSYRVYLSYQKNETCFDANYGNHARHQFVIVKNILKTKDKLTFLDNTNIWIIFRKTLPTLVGNGSEYFFWKSKLYQNYTLSFCGYGIKFQNFFQKRAKFKNYSEADVPEYLKIFIPRLEKESLETFRNFLWHRPMVSRFFSQNV